MPKIGMARLNVWFLGRAARRCDHQRRRDPTTETHERKGYPGRPTQEAGSGGIAIRMLARHRAGQNCGARHVVARTPAIRRPSSTFVLLMAPLPRARQQPGTSENSVTFAA